MSHYKLLFITSQNSTDPKLVCAYPQAFQGSGDWQRVQEMEMQMTEA